MAFTLELEEWIGSAWHRFITRRASSDFPAARVELAPRQRALGVLYRAMGGAAGNSVEAASERELLLRRNLLQQIAGTCRHAPLACYDGQHLHLPASLAVFADRHLNEELYRWLALLAARAEPMRHWGRDNQRWTRALLADYPGLAGRYRRLVEAHLQLRPDPASLNPAEAALERALRQALREPGSVQQFPRSERAAWPFAVALEERRGLGFARFDAALAEARRELGLDGLHRELMAERGLNRDEQRLAADRPPHWG